MTLFETALEELNADRKARERTAQAAYEAALSDKEFAAAERRRRELMPLIAKAKVFRNAEELKELTAEAEKNNAARSAALTRLGLTERAFTPKYGCSKCKDTGFVDGRACACINQRVIRLLERASGLPERKLNSFADSRLEKLSEKDRAFLAPVYEKMKQYAEKFPRVAKNDLLFLGPSGSGKTFLINAIAHEIGARGYTVLYTTAFSLNNLFLKYHTTFDGDKSVYMDHLLRCDFLVIDDLGTEPILKNVTQEYLFSVVNERLAAGKSTAVSTNLTLAELSQRYGERTASRIYNKGNTIVLSFKTSNLRAGGL